MDHPVRRTAGFASYGVAEVVSGGHVKILAVVHNDVAHRRDGT